jgi:hypothetical protein
MPPAKYASIAFATGAKSTGEGVREYPAQKEIDEQAALGVGMKEKAEEFVAAGGEIHGR